MKAAIHNKRGQTALEYLMTYGWTILIIGVIAVVLWTMGVFNPKMIPPGKSGFSQIIPVDWKVSLGGGNPYMTLVLSNDAGTKVVVGDINVTILNCMSTLSQTSELRAGQSNTYTIDLTSCSNSLAGEGEYYRADIVIAYQNVASGIPHLSVGECHGSIEA